MSDGAALPKRQTRSVGALEGQQLGLFDRPPLPSKSSVAPPDRRADTSRQSVRVSVLGSGSKGNAVLVECHGKRLLVDCGFSCRELERRCRRRGIELRRVDAIVLTHEHADHCRGAERISRRHGIDIFATPGTARGRALRRVPVRELRKNQRQEIAGFVIEAFDVPHDAREPVGLVVESSGGTRVGVLADAGRFDERAARSLEDLHGLVLESNHDEGMLRTGPYPWALKQRVAGAQGHLSNIEAGEAVRRLAADSLEWVVAYHLSEVNNMPALAENALAEALDRTGSSAVVELAAQGRPTPWLTANAPRREAHVAL
ncbi:MAG: MBL fold metallo-hydrolase [Acidobacteriota bacterium]